MQQLQFKIAKRNEKFYIQQDGNIVREATAEELAMWKVLSPSKDLTIWENLSNDMCDMPPTDSLAWWIYLRMGEVKIEDLTPQWIRSVILEYKNGPQALIVSKLRNEFPFLIVAQLGNKRNQKG